MKTRQFKLIIEYDGTDFAGWQAQPAHRTVQGELENALAELFQEQIVVTAAGRTDAGVHASGQVVNFSAHKNRSISAIQKGLNSILAETISIRLVEQIEGDFNARFDATKRYYRYQIVRGKSGLRHRYAWCVPDTLNHADMQLCARMILGEHDFRSFCRAKAEVKHHICCIASASWQYEWVEQAILVFRIASNRFLHNMVRILVGTMVEVGKGRFSTREFANMLAGKNRKTAGTTAPAKGLCLERVAYQ